MTGKSIARLFYTRLSCLLGAFIGCCFGAHANESQERSLGAGQAGNFLLSNVVVIVEYEPSEAEAEALNLFCADVGRKGEGKVHWRIGGADHQGAEIRLRRTGLDDASLAGMQQFQRLERYEISGEIEQTKKVLTIRSAAAMGGVYALSDLQRRIRRGEEGLYLGFQEWAIDVQPIVEYPIAERRGEYINIGYNMPGITPHEWKAEHWQEYIDELIISKLNTVYFYIWIDEFTTYPGSSKSKSAQSQAIHEGVKGMITYAKRRGMNVIYMVCPSFAPKDIWSQRPEIHAEIEYVDHGFAAVCLRAPGAMELMKDVWGHEMDCFREADGIQIWFYDPGGCWCDKHGCKANQAKFLASDFKTFAELFRSKNPQAQLAFNYWPIWAWEDQLKMAYRDDLNAAIKEWFSDEPYAITAVGAPDNDVTLPIREREAGFSTDIFNFGGNPESFYAFLIPNLNYHQTMLNRVLLEKGFRSIFGHRLEAKTRMMATYAMGAWMWKPDQTMQQVTAQWTGWKTGSDVAGMQLTEAILLLEEFTYNGANAHMGERAASLVGDVFNELPEPWKRDIGFYPAMFNAIAVLGKSVGVEHPDSFRNEFTSSLQAHPIFSGLTSDADRLFDRYRSFLSKGWKYNPF